MQYVYDNPKSKYPMAEHTLEDFFLVFDRGFIRGLNISHHLEKGKPTETHVDFCVIIGIFDLSLASQDLQEVAKTCSSKKDNSTAIQ